MVGAVKAIAPHPSDENIVYIGAVNGGVWASKNAKAMTLKVMSASTYVRRGSKWWSVLYQETPTP